MHPNTFLRNFWRLETRPEVFVAMSFDAAYTSRWVNVFKPAIEACGLKPIRVDESRTGDSILTEISDGIAHSRLVLGDVSVVGHTGAGRPFRNGNVMYEVGLALASRHPSDVLLVRDDSVPLLFDTSSIPHMTLDFVDEAGARSVIAAALTERLREQERLKDARIEIAFGQLSDVELDVLQAVGDYGPNVLWSLSREVGEMHIVPIGTRQGIVGLLDKGAIRLAARFEKLGAAYELTEMGVLLAKRTKSLPTVQPDAPAIVTTPTSEISAQDETSIPSA